MPERILVRHQLHAPLAAIGIQLANLFRRHRTRVAPDRLVAAVGEGVFGIELKLVHLQSGQHVHQPEKGVHRRHLVTADVQHHAARLEIRRVLDLAGRQRAPRDADKLRQRHGGIKKARPILRLGADAARRDTDAVRLRAGHLRHDAEREAGVPGGRGRPRSRLLPARPQGAPEQAHCRAQIGRRAGDRDDTRLA